MRLNSIFLGIFSRLICSDLFETNMDANIMQMLSCIISGQPKSILLAENPTG